LDAPGWERGVPGQRNTWGGRMKEAGNPGKRERGDSKETRGDVLIEILAGAGASAGKCFNFRGGKRTFITLAKPNTPAEGRGYRHGTRPQSNRGK